MRINYKILFVIINLNIFPLLIYSECHLQNQEINYTLAVLEGPKERVLKQFSIHHGCPKDRATTIAKYLMNPISEESKKWSKLYLNENWSFDYELLASAYIEGINRKPPDERISNILFEYNIPYVGQTREYAGFSMNLPGICNKPSYPVVEIDPRYRDYAFKGMKCQLSKQETNQFISMIKEDIGKNRIGKRVVMLIFIPQLRLILIKPEIWISFSIYGIENVKAYV